MRDGGLGAQFWSVFVPVSLAGEAAVAATMEQIDFVYRLVARYPDHLALCRSADEVEAAHTAGKVASLIGMEGGHSIACSLGALRMFHALGARYMTLTHWKNTPWADSATDEPAVGGLTAFGQEVVRECNRLGVMADLSHVAPSTMHATLDVSTAPAFFSHSSARALCDHPRNVPDDVLTRVRDSNGVVMVTFVAGFLTEDCRAWMDELSAYEEEVNHSHPEDSEPWRQKRDAWVADHPRPTCTVRDVADHVEHVREVAGVDCVGLGGDFDGITSVVVGLEDVSSYPQLFAELMRRGYTDDDLRKIANRNILRVLRGAELVAAKMQGGR
jgi:membrane dipeptidase